MIRTLVISTAAILLAACATSPRTDIEAAPQPATQSATPPVQSPPPASAAPATAGAFDPVGNYTFSADMQGQPIDGSMSITRAADGTLGGEMSSTQGAVRLRSVTLDGRRMTAYGTLENGPEISFVFNFEGERFSGTFDVQGTGGTISGTRKR